MGEANQNMYKVDFTSYLFIIYEKTLKLSTKLGK